MQTRIDLIQLFSAAAMMASAIFIALLAKDLGASDFMVGFAVMVYALMYFIASYVSGMRADKEGCLKFVKRGLFFAVIGFSLQLFVHNLYMLILVRAFAGWGVGLFAAALAAYAAKERAGKMGRFTAYSSLGWAVGGIISGMLSSYAHVFLISAVFLLLAFLISLQLEDEHKHLPSNINPLELFKKDARIYSVYLARSVAAQMVWAIFPLYLLSVGANPFWIGVLYFINTGSQFFFMQYVEDFNNRKLIAVGTLFTIFVFIGYGVAPNWIFLVPVQFLLAMGFSALQVGVFQELLQKHEAKAVVSANLNAVVNFSAVVGPLLGGLVSQLYGYRINMFCAAVIAAASFLTIGGTKRLPIRF